MRAMLTSHITLQISVSPDAVKWKSIFFLSLMSRVVQVLGLASAAAAATLAACCVTLFPDIFWCYWSVEGDSWECPRWCVEDVEYLAKPWRLLAVSLWDKAQEEVSMDAQGYWPGGLPPTPSFVSNFTGVVLWASGRAGLPRSSHPSFIHPYAA